MERVGELLGRLFYLGWGDECLVEFEISVIRYI
jgi:hypothetical protein